MDGNLARGEVDYDIIESPRLVTRRYVYATGNAYTEVTSKASWMGWPLFHMTLGRSPETGRRRVAKGWLAVGRFAVGGVALGQVALGFVAVAQLGFGLLFAVAQGGFSAYKSVSQIAVAPVAAYGQVALARTEAVGQVAVAEYAMGQVGMGRYVFDAKRRDPEAAEHFAPILSRLGMWTSGRPRPELEPSS